MGSIIPDDIIQAYQDAITFLRQDLGRDVVVYLKPDSILDCPNCRRDILTGASAYSYYPATPYPSGEIVCEYPSGLIGPVPFVSGPCPICHGRGRLNLCSTPTTYTCFVRVIDNLDDFQAYGDVKIGDFIIRAPDISKASFEDSDHLLVDGVAAQVRRVTQLYFQTAFEVEVVATRMTSEPEA